MKHSIFTKFVAIVLCAVSLVVCAAGAAGIIISEDNGLYTNDVDRWLDSELNHIGYYIARDYCSLYVAEHLEGFPEDVLEALRRDYFVEASRKDYAIEMYQDGTLVDQSGTIPEGALELTLDIVTSVPTILDGGNPVPSNYYPYTVFVHDALDKTGDVPEFVTEVAAGDDTVFGEGLIHAGGAAAEDAEAESIGAVFGH